MADEPPGRPTRRATRAPSGTAGLVAAGGRVGAGTGRAPRAMASAARPRAGGRGSSAASSSRSSCSSRIVTALATWVAAAAARASSRRAPRRRRSRPSRSSSCSCSRSLLAIRVFGVHDPAARGARPTPRSDSRTASPASASRRAGRAPVRGLAASFNTMAERLDRIPRRPAGDARRRDPRAADAAHGRRRAASRPWSTASTRWTRTTSRRSSPRPR